VVDDVGLEEEDQQELAGRAEDRLFFTRICAQLAL
jgi:hypothetical protein